MVSNKGLSGLKQPAERSERGFVGAGWLRRLAVACSCGLGRARQYLIKMRGKTKGAEAEANQASYRTGT